MVGLLEMIVLAVPVVAVVGLVVYLVRRRGATSK